MSDERAVRIAIAPQAAHLEPVAATGVETWAQHVSPVEYGSHTGSTLAEAAADAGAAGTLLNHSENRLKLADIDASLEAAERAGLETVACANTPDQVAAVSALGPDAVAIEPPELIGSGTPVSKADPDIVTDADQYDIGVFLNMDHQTDEEFIERQIELDIPSSIMIDASHEPFEENVAESKRVVEMVDEAGRDILVEAELGRIKGVEDEIVSEETFYTDPEEAVEFVDRTGCDLLAISVGTQHGVAKGHDLELRPDIARTIRQELRDHGLDTPLVLHGSSGILPEQLQEMLRHGVCKVNKETRYQYEYTRTCFDLYREHADELVPPDGIQDDRENFYNATEWSPNKDYFDPRVSGRLVRERIADVYAHLAEVAGSAGKRL